MKRALGVLGCLIALCAVSLTVSMIFIMVACSVYCETFGMDRLFMITGPVSQIILNLFAIFYLEYHAGCGHSGLQFGYVASAESEYADDLKNKF